MTELDLLRDIRATLYVIEGILAFYLAAFFVVFVVQKKKLKETA